MRRAMFVLAVLALGMTGCTRMVPSLNVIESVQPEDFAGSWRGVAVDRPNEGTQRMTMTLKIYSPKSSGGWKATVGGEIVDNTEQEVSGLRVRGNKLVFRLPGEERSTGPFWPMDIWLGFASTDKQKLLGVGLPVPARGWKEREDSFSIELTR